MKEGVALKLAGFLDNSLVNGEGLRAVVFVSGCNHNCKGCHNKEMQSFNYGEEVLVEDVLKRIKGNMPLIKGVTFSGGEPFEQALALSLLAEELKLLNVNIWCYTGYTYEELSKSKNEDWVRLLKSIDVLIDGPYKEDLTENPLKYTGSSNQRIIDLKATL